MSLSKTRILQDEVFYQMFGPTTGAMRQVYITTDDPIIDEMNAKLIVHCHPSEASIIFGDDKSGKNKRGRMITFNSGDDISKRVLDAYTNKELGEGERRSTKSSHSGDSGSESEKVSESDNETVEEGSESENETVEEGSESHSDSQKQDKDNVTLPKINLGIKVELPTEDKEGESDAAQGPKSVRSDNIDDENPS